jgi:hypothetical protein
MDGLVKAAYIDDLDIQTIAMQCFSEVPAIAYDYLGPDVNRMGSLTMAILESERHEVLRMAILFWTNLCREEI